MFGTVDGWNKLDMPQMFFKSCRIISLYQHGSLEYGIFPVEIIQRAKIKRLDDDPLANILREDNTNKKVYKFFRARMEKTIRCGLALRFNIIMWRFEVMRFTIQF